MLKDSFEKAKKIEIRISYLNEKIDQIQSVRKTVEMFTGKEHESIYINADNWNITAPWLSKIPFNIYLFLGFIQSQEMSFKEEVFKLTEEFDNL